MLVSRRLASSLAAVVALLAMPVFAADKAEAAKPLPPSKKVLVIARVPDMNRRGVVEDAFREQFAQLGLEVLTSVGELTEADFATPDALKAKIQSLGVDGVFGLIVEFADTSTGSSASISVGVAAPAYGGYGYGYGHGYGPYGYGAYVGATKQIGGDKTTARTTARLLFYNQPGEPAWEKAEKSTFDVNDLDVTAARIAKNTVKELKKKKLVADLTKK